MTQKILQVDDLQVSFAVRDKDGLKKHLHALSGVSLHLGAGEVLGVVGESGCGKSTLARTIMGLTKAQKGRISIIGQDITQIKGSQARAFRRHYQMIFQDPIDSINPRMTCGEIISEPIRCFFPERSRSTIQRDVNALMDEVGLDPSMIRRFPHEFSGGQRQRISIARALGVEPKLLVCDEAVSALDVSVQAQILNLLARIKQDRQLAMIFISHDLSVVRHVSDRILVMYLGYVIEEGPGEEVINHPRHPYTKSLIEAVSHFPRRQGVKPLEGDIPSPTDRPKGCPFSSRCPLVEPRCRERQPAYLNLDGHGAACYLAQI